MKKPKLPKTIIGKSVRRRPRLSFETLETRQVMSNYIVAENLLPGTPQSQWGVGAGDSSIQGFATDIGVDQGQTISFKINSAANANYHIDVYRMGYYQGNGARLVTTIPSSQVNRQVQPTPLTDNATGLVDAGNWSVSASWSVPTNATSGLYFARATRDDTGGASLIYFVVRDDDGQSDLLFQTSDSTWQAYNTWVGSGNGTGNSLYVYGGNNPALQSAGRATKVSYNRPLTLDATFGGLGDYNSPLHSEYPMVRWLEANGYDVSYTTDVDSDRRGAEILEHKAYLSVGHDEYWSAGQRNNVEAARDAGVNLAFFSGNEVFWKTRWESSISSGGTSYRTLVCYKESKDNAKSDPLATVSTGTWRDNRWSPPADGGRPENSLTGTVFMNDRTSVDLGIPLTVPAANANLRFWRNTSVAGLTTGQTATLGQFIVGYEVDEDLDNGFRPAGLVDMSTTTFTTMSRVNNPWGSTVGPGNGTHALTMYRAASGALVFGAGTVQWSWGLDGNHNNTPTTADPAIQQATVNLFADMYVQPATLQSGLVRATASTDFSAPTSSITSPTGGNFTVGSTVTITGTATESGGGVVGAVEVSVDGGATWHPATGKNNWTFTWIVDKSGPVVIKSRATDDSGNIEPPSAGKAVTVSYQANSTTNLVAAYSFNEGTGTTVADSSGRGNNGTISGATWTGGVFGQALAFNGSNTWITINDANSLDLTSGMTLQAWVKPTATATNWTAVMIKEAPGALAYGLYAADGANQPPAAYINTNFDYSAKGVSQLPLNTWSFLTATYDGTTLSIYVNGTLASTMAASGLINTSSGVLRIGGDSIWGEYFQGSIDQVRIYNRSLNLGEIRSDMSTPIGGVLESTAPTGSITAPAAGSTVSGITTLSAIATDNVVMAGVQFRINGVDLGAPINFAPYSVPWDTRKVPNGNYSISASAIDAAGNTAALGTISVTVSNAADTILPTIHFTNPTSSSSTHGVVPLAAFAADNIAIAGVQFKVNGVNVGAEDTVAPYAIAWNTATVADGTYAITAVTRDIAGNTATTSSISVDIDNTAPTVTSRSPASGAVGVPTSGVSLSASFSEAVLPETIGMVLRDSANHVLPGSLSYNSTTKTVVFTPSISLEPSTAYTVTLQGVQDLAGITAATTSWSFTTTSIVLNASLWNNSATPAILSDNDFNGQELGVKFSSEIAGYVTGVRFYKGPQNGGTHFGHLWTSSGTLLATVVFTNETATGWQQASFSQPVQISPNITYVASYYAPQGGYSATPGYFVPAGVDAGILHSPSGTNGLYRVGESAFPTNSFNGNNYWVDVVFSNILAPTASSMTPAANASNVPATSPGITATFSKPVQSSSIVLSVHNAAGNLVTGTTFYDSATATITFTPSGFLSPLTTYTVTVSSAVDLAGTAMPAPVSWSFTTAALDTTPPTVSGLTPTPGSNFISNGAPALSALAVFGEDVKSETISFVLRDSAGNIVPSTFAYDTVIRTVGLIPNAPVNFGTTYTVTLSGAEDLSGNVMTPVSWSFNTSEILGASLFSSSATPAGASSPDSTPQEVGLQFHSDVGGYINGIRFYKGPANTGTHVAHVWAGSNALQFGSCGNCSCGAVCFTRLTSGTLLASATFTNEGSSGWQRVDFERPVQVMPGVTYVVSYTAPHGGYAFTSQYFTSAGVTSGVLHTPGTSSGVFGAIGAMPISSYNASNYWIDVDFTNNASDVRPPAVASTTPASGTTWVPTTSNLTATFTEDVDVTAATFVLRDGAGTAVAASVSWTPAPDDPNSLTLILTPHAPLAFLSSYTATVSGVRDLSGNTMAAPYSWSFTTAPGGTITNASIWSSSATPQIASSTDGTAQELGVKFSSDLPGYITGLRYFKGSGNLGTHVGHLWTASGTLLATATFVGESASGWQQVNFSQPVAITANTTYVASYFAPTGHYAYTGAYFTSETVTGVLRAAVNGGVFANGPVGTFPTNTYNSANYWVDVLFNTTLTPGLTASSPAANATGVRTTAGVSVTFNEMMNAGTINAATLRLRAAGASSDVPATIQYSGLTAVLQPSAPLAINTTYQVTLAATAADTFGNQVGNDIIWTFTTQQYLDFLDNLTSDFSGGTTGPNTAIAESSDGEVTLSPGGGTEFFGTSLPSGWTSTVWTTGGAATVAGGRLTVDGAIVQSTPFTSGHSLRFSATFSGDAYQHAGFASPGSSAPWAIFSTGSGGGLYARTMGPGGPLETALGGNWLGASHSYRIDWGPTSVTYLIDGVQVASHTSTLTSNMVAMASDYNSGAGAVVVDWMRVTPYAAAGTYSSKIFDAGSNVTWLDALWTSQVPAGTSLVISVRLGNTPTPDGSWTDFFPLGSSASSIGAIARYAQYRVDLGTTTPADSPALQSIALRYSQGADSVAPAVIKRSPGAGGILADRHAPLTIGFSDNISGSTVNASTVRLRAVGSSVDVPALATVSGATVTLTPLSPLEYDTAYQVTVGGTVADLGGNILGNDVVWTFTTGSRAWTQSILTNFGAGVSSGTAVTTGNITLAGQFSDGFDGSALGTSWSPAATGGGTAVSTVSGSTLTLGATEVYSTQTYAVVPVAGRISFGAAPYQHFGLTTLLGPASGNYWAMFSTAGTNDTIFARVNANGAVQDVNLGARPSGFHDFLIKPVSGGFEFWIDGALKTTISASFAASPPLKLVISNYNGQAPTQADSISIPQYSTVGSFTSAVFDATTTAVWGDIHWTGTTPAGTSVVIQTRSGNSASPDGAWSTWSTVANGSQIASPSSRYLQYRLVLTSSDPLVTPTILDMELNRSID